MLLSLFVYWSLQPARTGLMTGLALGVNLMSRPTYFLAGVCVLGVRSLTLHAAWRYVAVAVLTAVVVGMPWITRNWMLLGEPVLASTSFEDVWKGNNIAANGSSYVAPGKTVFDVAPDDLRSRMAQGNELQVETMFAQETFAFVEQQPAQFAGLVARKFVYFWWLPQAAGMLYPAAWLTAYKLYAVVIFSFAAVGALAIVRRGGAKQRALLTTIVVLGLTLALLHALSYVEGRHRWGVEPLILLITAHGMLSVGPGCAVATGGLSGRCYVE